MNPGTHIVCVGLSLATILASAPALALSDGYYDSTWAGGGRILFGGDVHNPNRSSEARQVQLENNGSLLLAGEVDPGGFDYWWLGELRPDGTPAPTFGEGNGLATSCHLSAGLCTGNGFSAFALQSNGRVDVTDNATLTRANANAQTLDTSISGGTGHVSLIVPIDNLQGSMTYGFAIAPTPSGQWIVAGAGYYSTATSGNSDFAAIRLQANLALDTGFNHAGVFGGGQLVAFDGGGGNTDAARAVIVQSDGRIVLAGYASPGVDAAFARLNTEGSLDSTFGGGGTGTMILGGMDGHYFTPRSVKADRAGRILVATRSIGKVLGGPYLFVARLTSDGVLDAGVGTTGLFQVPVPLCVDATANAIALDSAGRILVAGVCNVSVGEDVFLVARLNGVDGSLDTTFGVNGFSYGAFDTSSTSDEAIDVVIDGSGRPTVVGVSQPTGGTQRSGVARLTYDLIYTNDFETAPRGCLPPDCN